MVPNLEGRVAGIVLMLENNGDDTATGVNNTPVKVPIVKRRRQDGVLHGDEMDITDQAASSGEGRRAQ